MAASVNLLLSDDTSNSSRTSSGGGNCDASESNKSIDSDKTEDPRYPWDAKIAANTSTSTITPKRSEPTPWTDTKASTKTPSTIQESPTTKTLNSFSQNMDDLHCEPPCCIDNNPSTIGNNRNKDESNTTATAFADNYQQQALPPLTCCDLPHGYDLDWEIHPIRIVPPPTAAREESSPQALFLGIVIGRNTFPLIATREEKGEQPRRRTQKTHCLVKRLPDDGMGIRCGLQQGDWFLRPMDVSSLTLPLPQSAIRNYETNGPLKLATFDEIQEWLKESSPSSSSSITRSYRPIRVLRRRRRQESYASLAASTNESKQAGATVTWMTTKRAKEKPRSTSSSSTAAAAVTLATSKKIPIMTAPTANTTLLREPQAKANSSRKSDDDSTDSNNNTSNIPPYCVLCNYYNPKHWWPKNRTYGKRRTKPKRAPRNHHTWCPKHNDFDAKRVEKVLARMNHCHRVLGCEACHMEYQTGKVISIRKKGTPTIEDTEDMVHNAACLLYRETLKKEERRKRKQQEEEEAQNEEEIRKRQAALAKQARVDGASRKKRKHGSTREKVGKTSNRAGKQQARGTRYDRTRTPTNTRGYGSSSYSSSDEDDGCEDGSIYRPPTRKARMETFSFPRKRRTDNFDASEAVGDDRNQSIHEENGGDDERVHNTKPVWVPLYDNPWGEEGYQTGDVLLFGPQRGIGHHETQNLNGNHHRRYKANPFGDGSTYRTTHCTPEDGLALVCLKRDPMGRMPWGFQPIRDEFGHACLVESVDRHSPASAATFVGVPRPVAASSSGGDGSASTCGALNANDMIIAINGTPVGGMTEAGLELELETTAPRLLLAVSRYKHAEKVARKFAEMERSILDIMDRAARDDRLMGWREVGCGDGIEPRSREAGGTVDVSKAVPPSLPVPPSQPERIALNSSPAGGPIRQDDDDNGGLPSHKEMATVEKTDLPTPETLLEHIVANREKRISGDQNDQTREMSSIAENLQIGLEADGNLSSKTSDDSAAHDENPQMGCVCGVKHSSSRVKTFWIQCESCNSWYHVAEKCIGFDDRQANRPDFEWNCAACVPDTESDEEIVPSNNDSSGHTRKLQLDKAKHDSSQQRNRCEDKLHNQSAKPEESTVFANMYSVNSSEQQPHLDLTSESISEPIPPKGRSENKPAIPLALRQLKSHNRDGLSYWEDLKVEQLPNNPDRSLRKREVTTNQRDQIRVDGGGGKDQTVLSKNKKRDARSNKVEGKLKYGEKDKRQALSKRARSHSVKERVDPEIEGDDDPSVMVSGKSDGEPTTPIRRFEVGDLVYVESHAWSYVNNSGGIGFIQKAYIDDDGDRVYDVKYPALDRTERRIEAEFISPYCFD